MKYKEQAEIANKIFDKLKNGKSVEDVTASLKQKNYYEKDIKQILRIKDNLVFKEYESRIKYHILEDNLEEHLDDFELVDAELFEELQYSAIEKINSPTNKEVDKYLSQGLSKEEIWNKIKNPYFSEEHLDEQIEKYNYYNEPVDGLNNSSRRIIGLILICIGVALSFSMSIGSGAVVFYGMIIAGLYMLTGNFKTKSDIEYERKFSSNPFKKNRPGK